MFVYGVVGTFNADGLMGRCILWYPPTTFSFSPIVKEIRKFIPEFDMELSLEDVSVLNYRFKPEGESYSCNWDEECLCYSFDTRKKVKFFTVPILEVVKFFTKVL